MASDWILSHRFYSFAIEVVRPQSSKITNQKLPRSTFCPLSSVLRLQHSFGQLDIVYIELAGSQRKLGIVAISHTDNQLLNRADVHTQSVQVGKGDVPYLPFSAQYGTHTRMVYDSDSTITVLNKYIQIWF